MSNGLLFKPHLPVKAQWKYLLPSLWERSCGIFENSVTAIGFWFFFLPVGTIAIQKHEHKFSGSNWIPEGHRPSGSSHSAEARGRIEYTLLEVTNTLSGIERVLRHLSLLPISVIKVCRKLVQSRQACCCCSVLLESCCVHKKKTSFLLSVSPLYHVTWDVITL